MTRKTINSTLQMPNNKDCESHRHYFTPMQTKISGTIQFYEGMGIKYIKRHIFYTFNISIY